MLDLPLHPILVHFPIAIGCLMPLVMMVCLFGIKRWQWPVRTWWMVVFLQSIFLVSAAASVKTGEWDEESGRAPLVSGVEEHEELGEKVPVAAGVVFLFTLLPVIFPKRSYSTMIASIIASVVVVYLLILTGHSGGRLVHSPTTNNQTFEED